MKHRRPSGHIVAVLGFTLVSRAIGFLRELIIAAGFGFSQATDAFYQLAATPTYLITYICGPFATSYIAWTNGADAPDPALCQALAARWLLLASGVLTVGMAAVGMAIDHRGGASFGLPQMLMAGSCVTVGLVGFCSTVANARARFARAQSILFANNLGFVLFLGAGALLFRHSVLVALTGAFALAAVVATVYGLRTVAGDAPAKPQAFQLAQLRQSARRHFLPMLGYASIETLGSLATQALVLALASSSGVGVASAGSLAQRIALTVNGLVINPLSNIAMVKLSKLPDSLRRGYLVRVATLTLGCLAAVAAVLSVMAHGLTRFAHSASGTLLASLIPGYALWLVAQGTNMMLSRLSFARGTVRLYTGVTLAGYAVGNLLRFLVWRQWGFGPAIVAGSIAEVLAALIVLLVIAFGADATPACAAKAHPA